VENKKEMTDETFGAKGSCAAWVRVLYGRRFSRPSRLAIWEIKQLYCWQRDRRHGYNLWCRLYGPRGRSIPVRNGRGTHGLPATGKKRFRDAVRLAGFAAYGRRSIPPNNPYRSCLDSMKIGTIAIEGPLRWMTLHNAKSGSRR
jgi:hypothetical protein